MKPYTTSTHPYQHSYAPGYDGKLITYAITGQSTRADVHAVKRIIHQVVQEANLPETSFIVDPNRDIHINHVSHGVLYPNLFLPESERTEASRLSFDTVISYLAFLLSKAGYDYNGSVFATSSEKNWKLTVQGSEVFRTEGRVVVVYNDEESYQVGGVEL